MAKKSKIQYAYPLSPMQSGLLFQALYSPDSDAYFVQSIFEVEGKIDVQVLQTAWQIVSDHHNILKTGFVWQDGKKPFQYVLESVLIPFTIHDWQYLCEENQRKSLKSLFSLIEIRVLILV